VPDFDFPPAPALQGPVYRAVHRAIYQPIVNDADLFRTGNVAAWNEIVQHSYREAVLRLQRQCKPDNLPPAYNYRKVQYSRNCPPLGFEKRKHSTTCHKRNFCPYCWGRCKVMPCYNSLLGVVCPGGHFRGDLTVLTCTAFKRFYTMIGDVKQPQQMGPCFEYIKNTRKEFDAGGRPNPDYFKRELLAAGSNYVGGMTLEFIHPHSRYIEYIRRTLVVSHAPDWPELPGVLDLRAVQCQSPTDVVNAVVRQTRYPASLLDFSEKDKTVLTILAYMSWSKLHFVTWHRNLRDRKQYH
jgi:hypothetical protein